MATDSKVNVTAVANGLAIALFSALLTIGGAVLQQQSHEMETMRDEIGHGRSMLVVVCGQLNELYRGQGSHAENECSDWATATVGVPW